ncbi:MAG: FAD-dependent oxidoreductase [Candidatus Binatia bacterium]
MNRTDILDRVKKRSEPWDVVVIGGGATGVGCAVDAASRGLDVLLLEQHDFGKGTSSRSTKLVHGGVRYLAQGNVSLVREALRERGILLKNAPHVVQKLAFVVPCYSLGQKIFYVTGLRIYDLLAGKYGFGRSRIISKTETLARLPNIKPEGLLGGVRYYDGQFDDARLLIDLVMTAHALGAAVLNYAKVVSLVKGPTDRIAGANFAIGETGETFIVAARAVINATGVFCDDVRSMSDTSAKPVVTFSQGIHLVLDRKFLRGDDAVLIPKTTDGRVLFCIPWHGHTLVGTTDTPIGHAALEPEVFDRDIDFVLETAGQYLAKKPSRLDILSVFAGIRPLVKPVRDAKTSAISRGHHLFVERSGLITITGGKWTIYRRMAEDAVDHAVRLAGRRAMPSLTADLKIHDGSTQPSSTKGERLHPDLPYSENDVIAAVQNEMAQTVEDVLARRTRALFLNALAAIKLAPKIAKIMAGMMGKDSEWEAAQIEQFNVVANNYLPHD